MTSAIARALRLGSMTGVLGFVTTVALAQQGWEPTVSVGQGPPEAAARVTAKTSPSRARRAALPAVDVEPRQQADEGKVAVAKTVAVPEPSLETGSIKGDRAAEYCTNIANPAADARFAWQKKMLADMEQDILKRIALLEQKTAEYQKWLARRDEFSKKANETVLRIYARMRPDAAAAQLAALDGETAASLLTKLQPRIASLILNEMEPSHAVRLTATISGAGKVAANAGPKNAPEAKAK